MPETPAAKASDPRISIPGEWKAPSRGGGQGTELAKMGGDAPFARGAGGARVDFGFGGAHVRTIEVRGPLAFVLALGVLAVVGLIVALVVVFAVGVGAAFAIGGAAAAVLGMGAAAVRRRLPGSRRSRLDAGQGEP
jgi:hypothetical protein